MIYFFDGEDEEVEEEEAVMDTEGDISVEDDAS